MDILDVDAVSCVPLGLVSIGSTSVAKTVTGKTPGRPHRNRGAAGRAAAHRLLTLTPEDSRWRPASYRDRLRARFLEKGEEALTHFELLELLLCIARPRRSIKTLATDLFRRFGGFGSILGAPGQRLREIAGMDDAILTTLKVVKAAAVAMQREEVMEQPVISSWKALVGYCRSVMAYERNEQLRVLFLDARNCLMADEVQSRGTIDQTPIYPREIIGRALEIGATALILVHNHPSGDPAPSREDIALTLDLKTAAANLGIAVHDHLIVARSGHISFKTLGLL